MEFSWIRMCRQYAEEAQAFLKESRLPFEYKEIIKEKTKQPNDRLELAATLVVSQFHSLKREVKKNNTQKAVQKIFDLMSSYEEMIILQNVEDYERRLVFSVIDDLKKGVRARKDQEKGASSRRTSKEKIDKWQSMADEIHKNKPELSKRSIAILISKQTKDSFETIRKYISIPK